MIDTKKFSILYAEDDKNIRKKYIKLFKIYFDDIYEASDGEEALNLYYKYKPNILILDINMPKINGLEVAKKIRKDDLETLIIMLTAHSEKEKLLEAIELNLTKYLIKPIKTLELENILQKALSNLKKMQEKKNIILLNGDFRWNKQLNELYSKDEQLIKLTKKEYLLFKLFCKSPCQTFSNHQIMEYVWEDDIGNYNPNKLRILLSKLRSKLNTNLFQSIYNIGYKINLKN